MREKISFLILTHQGSHTRQFVTSKKTISLLFLSVAGLLLACVVVGAYFVHDYRELQKTVAGMPLLKERIASQQTALADQHQRIQSFALKINTLKDELIALKELETRVRKISRIKDTDKETKARTGGHAAVKTEFGVGGPLPEDVNSRLVIDNNHSCLIDEMHVQADLLTRASQEQAEQIKELLSALVKKKRKMACTPSIWPVRGQITSKFGYRRSDFTGKREFHKGCDIGAPKGTPIMAAADGMVTFSGRRSSYGNVIEIDHGRGYRTRYAHISKLLKKKGQWVTKGEVIARVGSTGRSTGPHVHFEVLKNGVQVNPHKYLVQRVAARHS